MREAYEAWKALGIDPDRIFSRLAALPRRDRAAAAVDDLAVAKKAAKAIMAANHPDKGGDAARFRDANDAMMSLEAHVDRFVKSLKEAEERAAEKAARRPVYIKIGP
jgi:hypothetical protein